jgi:hypothetical protein
MDKFNIKTLFGSSIGPPTTTSLFSAPKKIDKVSKQLTIKYINDMKIRKKKMNRISYRNVLKLCTIKIQNATKINQSFLFFEIPSIMLDNQYYDPSVCSEYVIKKIKRMSEKDNVKIDISQINQYNLLFQW